MIVRWLGDPERDVICRTIINPLVNGPHPGMPGGAEAVAGAAFIASEQAKCEAARGRFGWEPGNTGNFECCCPDGSVWNPNTQMCECVLSDWDGKKCIPVRFRGAVPNCGRHYYPAILTDAVTGEQYYECRPDPVFLPPAPAPYTPGPAPRSGSDSSLVAVLVGGMLLGLVALAVTNTHV